MLVVNAQLSIPLGEFRFTFARSGGPGGQNVNKLNTKALLHWPVLASPSLPAAVRERLLRRHGRLLTAEGEFLVMSQRFREAPRNVADCLEKLRAMLAEAAQPPKPRRPTRPSRASVRRRLETKRRRGEKKAARRGGRGGEDGAS